VVMAVLSPWYRVVVALVGEQHVFAALRVE
jgi:hypothetical protein